MNANASLSSTAPAAPPPEPTPPLLRPGDTCLCQREARRFRLLVDGAEYFSVLRRAIARARHSVMIVGWDIDSRMQLTPGAPDDGLPAPLADFLCAVAEKNRRLRIHILAWDFAMLYALEREWLPSYRLGWRTHRRILFRLDGRHPPGASHHQKVVVIDDRLAFVGGIDLTRSRWDTSAHAPEEPRRRNARNTPYSPMHDVHSMFDGEAARAVADIVRERWRRASGRTPQAGTGDAGPALPSPLPLHACGPARSAPAPGQAAPAHLARPANATNDPFDAWPPNVVVDIERVTLGLALTEPAFDGRPAVQQIRALYLAAIAAARENIYIENQYFTASPIGAALAARLAEAASPDVAVVVPRRQTGWLQDATMGVLRARLYDMLKAADRHGRLRLYMPHIDGLGEAFVNVHSKLMIVDDELLLVGSANLNNRSMVLDTECNVALEARGDPRVRAAIARMRNRLLAEHLDVDEKAVETAFAAHGGLHATIDALRHAGRTLAPLEPSVPPEFDRLIPEEALIDPETPAEPATLVHRFAPGGNGRSLTARLLLLGALALGALAAALAWHLTPLGQHLSFTTFAQAVERLSRAPFGPAAIVAAFAVAAIVSVPVTLLIATSGFVFGPLEGSLYALAGTLIAAVATYYAGAWLGRDAVRRLAGTQLNRLSERLGRQGIVAVVILRVVPLAPFSLVNLAAGASHIGIRDYVLGTALGMGPGIVLATTFAHQLVAALRRPSAGSLLLLAAIGIALVALSFVLQRVFAKRR